MARRSSSPKPAPSLTFPCRRIVMVGFPDFQILDVTGPLEVFSRTARWLVDNGYRQDLAYSVELVAAKAGPLAASSGLKLVADRRFRDLGAQTRGADVDTLLVAGGRGARAAANDTALLAWLARFAPRVRRLGSVCTGTFILAAAGLLNGRHATTHWSSCDALAKLHPGVTIEPDPIFVRDGCVYTSAGVTAGMDLALALVEEDFGRHVALQVARQLVLFLRRPGGQSQFSTQLAVQAADREPLRELQHWIADHLSSDLSVDALAGRAAMSPRHFARVFASQLGMTPARFVEVQRVEAARRRLEESRDGVDEVAATCGFGGAEVMRRAFLRTVKVSPSDYRSRFRSAAFAAPRLPPSRSALRRTGRRAGALQRKGA
jgi:transcriptional regulator GlxA family with amidase domain